MRGVSRTQAAWIGVFVALTLLIGGVTVVGISRRQWRWQSTYRLRADFAQIAGVNVGDRVRIQGIDAGVVESIVAPQQPGGPVGLWLRIDDRLRPLVRADAVAAIAPQGVVGAKVIEIQPGKPDAPVLADGATLTTQPTRDLGDLMRDAQLVLKRVDAVATSAEKGISEITQIASSIREGKGSLGKLVQDEEAYRALVSLSGRGQKTLNELEENLTALKHTWPLSTYFNDRSYFDREKVLFQPGAAREGRSLQLDSMFEPGRSVLTSGGRGQLDNVGAWFKKALTKNSQVVIAVFSPDAHDAELAQMLTQEQANTVRKYLVDRFKIDTVGWFGSRKVAAVGFGTQVPRTLVTDESTPGSRVEIILFTPQM